MEIYVGNLAYATTDEGLKAAVAAASAVVTAVPAATVVTAATPAGNRTRARSACDKGARPDGRASSFSRGGCARGAVGVK